MDKETWRQYLRTELLLRVQKFLEGFMYSEFKRHDVIREILSIFFNTVF